MNDPFVQFKPYDEPHTTGTTIMAVLYDGGVLIGADSRSSAGTYVADRSADKLDYVHDRIFCLRSGSAADTQTIGRYTRYYLDAHATEIGRLPAVKTAARIFSNFIYEYKDQLSASIIVAGWDPYKGGQIYQVPPGGAVIESDWAIGGSGSTFIWGYCDANFKKNSTLQEARNFVINSVSHAIARDGSSGGSVRLLNITKDLVQREFIEYKDLPNK